MTDRDDPPRDAAAGGHNCVAISQEPGSRGSPRRGCSSLFSAVGSRVLDSMIDRAGWGVDALGSGSGLILRIDFGSETRVKFLVDDGQCSVEVMLEVRR